MLITNISNSIVFSKENMQYIFPVNSIYIINIGDVITVRLLGNRRNIFSFNYNEVTNISASNIDDFISQINSLIFK